MRNSKRELEHYLPYARHVVQGPSIRRSLPAGYGIKPGMRVLLAVDSYYDPLVVEAIMRAIREEGARVDLLSADMGPDHELDELDEVRASMGNTPWGKEPIGPPAWRRELQWFTERQGYDLLIGGLGRPKEKTPYAYEGIPWVSRENLPSVIFPHDLWDLINRKAWEVIWEYGPGGRVHLTDPEGTDLTFTLLEEHFKNPRDGFGPEPLWGHLHGHPVPPLLPGEDAHGVVAGTTNHWGRPFPHIRVHVAEGRVERIEGGGQYGEAWRQLLEATRDVHYPEFPRPGLFWLWEAAIGTNPKFVRPRHVLMRSRGNACERLRSGIIHIGFGTRPVSPAEEWARAEGVPYGHLHVHLCFPTYEVTSRRGDKLTVVYRGHLTALGDPDVIALAATYGDPREVLRVAWTPSIPGIMDPGSYMDDYARDPASYLKRHERSPVLPRSGRRAGRPPVTSGTPR